MTDDEKAVRALREIRAMYSPGTAARQAAERGQAALTAAIQRAIVSEARVAAFEGAAHDLMLTGAPDQAETWCWGASCSPEQHSPGCQQMRTLLTPGGEEPRS